MRRWLPPFPGRLGRRGFWSSGLALGLAFAGLFAALEATAGHASTLALYPPFYLGAFSLGVRRLHDRDRSGLWLLLLLLPILGPLLLGLEMALRAGTRGENRHGPDPRLRADYQRVA